MSKIIDSLTPEQEAKIPGYLEKYLAIGLSTEPCDRKKAEAAVRASYRYNKLGEPKGVFWCDSPFTGARIAAYLALPQTALLPSQTDIDAYLKSGHKEITKEVVKEQMNKASYGSFEAFWVSFYSFIAYELPVKKDELIYIVNDAVNNCGVYWTFEDCIIMSERPKAIHMKDKKLHNPNGLALEYRDGSGIVAFDGVKYPNLMEMHLQKHTIKD